MTLGSNEDKHVVRDLITLPVRLPWLATRLGLRFGGRLATVTFRVAERLAEAAASGRAQPRDAKSDGRDRTAISTPEMRAEMRVADLGIAEPPPRPQARRRRPSRAARRAPAAKAAPEPPAAETSGATPASDAVSAPRAAATTSPTAAFESTPRRPSTPPHVSEEEVLVESFAEAGAEDGVGAAVHVKEPWEGYRKLPARDIMARLAAASAEELAAVELYESTHRRRRTVLAATNRQLRIATAVARRPG